MKNIPGYLLLTILVFSSCKNHSEEAMYEKAMESCQCVRYKTEYCKVHDLTFDDLDNLVDFCYQEGLLTSDEKFQEQFDYELFDELTNAMINRYTDNCEDLLKIYTSVWGDMTVEGGGTVIDLFKFSAKHAAELGKPELEGTINNSALANDFAKEDGLFSAEVLAKYGKQLPTVNEMPTGEIFSEFKLRIETEFDIANQITKLRTKIDWYAWDIVNPWFEAAEELSKSNIIQDFFRSNPTIELAGGTLTKIPGEGFYRFNVDFPLFGIPELTDWQTSILVSKGGKLDNRDYQLSRKEVEFLLAEELKRKEGRLDMFLPRRAGDVKEKVESFSLRAFHDKHDLLFAPYKTESFWTYKWAPFAKDEKTATNHANWWSDCPEEYILIAPKEKCAKL